MPNNGFDTKLVKDLAKILKDSELTEIEIDHEGTKIRVTRNISVAAPITYAPPPVTVQAAPQPSAPIADAAPKTVADVTHSANNVTSPMVGTAYLSPEPGARPFVNVGDNVKEGQQLFVIEAMKTLNPVNAPRAGVVTAIMVADAQPVEFGEALCTIE